jgi:hypothetical protein
LALLIGICSCLEAFIMVTFKVFATHRPY